MYEIMPFVTPLIVYKYEIRHCAEEKDWVEVNILKFYTSLILFKNRNLYIDDY